MLDDDFMWPLVLQARMGLADAQLVRAGWGEYKGDVLVADLQREKVRLEREIAHAEHEWLVAQEAYEAA